MSGGDSTGRGPAPATGCGEAAAPGEGLGNARRADFLDTLMDAAVDAIIIIDHRGRIERFNLSAQRLFGYTEQEILGRNVRDLMPEPNRGRHDSYLENYLRTGQPAIIGKGRREQGMRKNGEIFPMWLSVGESRRGGKVNFVGIIHDLTHRVEAENKMRRLEQQLFHADRLVTLGELTAGIAHEINQPLTAIAAYADAGRQIAGKPGAVGDDLMDVCARIGEQSRRAAAVVTRLRKLVRGGGVSKSRHDINDIVRNMLPLFEHEVNSSDIRIEFEAVDGLPEIYVDEIQIQQVLVNLVKNSMDAIRDDGRSEGRIRIVVVRREENLAISVSDDGPGVPVEQETHLFEPFFTSKPKGVGLGLSICKSIAAVHGGRLVHERPESGGARFILSLPLAAIG
ncbi:two-component system sensor histidine kinase NtrB [Elongatibacter sediminis]|uniref:Sensor protein FixL n=1 Tax=Elongatibacter sediminis TaxID=3119006 RepID=A0AAW9REV5_9GAMM